MADMRVWQVSAEWCLKQSLALTKNDGQRVHELSQARDLLLGSRLQLRFVLQQSLQTEHTTIGDVPAG